MRGIILAAGRGSRMKHLTSERPKCMVKLRGKPLIEWQLEALRAAGINDIAIVTGYRHELLSSYKLTKFHNARWTETNMVASLACADKWLRSEPSIVSYSDIFYDSSAVTSLIDCPGSLAVTYDPNWLSIWEKRFEDPLLDAETFSLNSSNQIIEIGNKPKTVEEVQGQYMGLLRITPEGWKQLVTVLENFSENKRGGISMTMVLQTAIKHSKVKVTGVPYLGEWGEIDSQSDLEIFHSKKSYKIKD